MILVKYLEPTIVVLGGIALFAFVAFNAYAVVYYSRAQKGLANILIEVALDDTTRGTLADYLAEGVANHPKRGKQLREITCGALASLTRDPRMSNAGPSVEPVLELLAEYGPKAVAAYNQYRAQNVATPQAVHLTSVEQPGMLRSNLSSFRPAEAV